MGVDASSAPCGPLIHSLNMSGRSIHGEWKLDSQARGGTMRYERAMREEILLRGSTTLPRQLGGANAR